VRIVLVVFLINLLVIDLQEAYFHHYAHHNNTAAYANEHQLLELVQLQLLVDDSATDQSSNDDATFVDGQHLQLTVHADRAVQQEQVAVQGEAHAQAAEKRHGVGQPAPHGLVGDHLKEVLAHCASHATETAG